MSSEIRVTLAIILTVVGIFCCQNANNANKTNDANVTNVALAAEKININTATLEELDTLKGIGPSKAQAIINYRTANGPFKTIEEIMNVSGIKQATFDDIKDSITVGEAAVTPPPSEPQATSTPEQQPPPALGGGSQKVIYSDEIIINEVMINPEDSDADNEFIELYNKSASEIDLSGWILEDIQGAIKKYKIEDGIKISGLGYKAFYASETQLVLNNSGDGVKLFWPNNELAKETPANSGPADEDVSYSFDGREWRWTVKPTPGARNEIISANELTYWVTRVVDGDTIEIETGEKVRYIGIDTPENDEVKNEIQCFGKEALSKNQELVLNKKVRLEKDTSDKDSYGRLLRYVYAGELFVNEYLVREGMAYSYPYPPDTKYQNQLDEAEKAAQKNINGLWQKCKASEAPAAKIYAGKVVINEIFPNPGGSDETGEWIELVNLGDEPADMTNWKLSDSTDKIYSIKPKDFETVIVSAKSYFLIKRQISAIALNNTGGDLIKLFGPNDQLIDQAEYSGTVVEEASWARVEAGGWQWTSAPTPGMANKLELINQPPKAVIGCSAEALIGDEVLFDASDSSDPDGGELNYFWEITGTEGTATSAAMSFDYTFFQPGDYQVSLIVVDSGGASSTAKTSVKILKDEAGSTKDEGRSEEIKNYQIVISEVLPNPAGSDLEGEFIEIYNAGKEAVNLAGWKLDDEEGGSSSFTISGNKIIEPNKYFVFWRKETGIALNNDIDELRMFNGNDEIADQIDYEKVSEGMSFSKFSDGWHWTAKLSPGGENVLEEKLKLTSSTASKSLSIKSSGGFIQATLEEARNFEKGEKIKVQGMVAVEPGILGSQFFYIVGSPGIQVYCYKKDFPNLKVGDSVEVAGEISESGGEKRIKIASKNDIKMLDTETSKAVAPVVMKIEEIDDDVVGSLAAVEGELIEKSGASYFVDDGTGEIKVYIKSSTKIKKPALNEGDNIKAAGIISKVGGQLALLPRYQSDIALAGNESPITGETASSAIEISAGRAVEWEKYLWWFNGAIIAADIGLWERKRRKRNRKS